jgi:hypothetical protein
MYRGRLWTMRQFAGFGSPEDTNQRFKYLLEHGQTGLSTAFDMPSLMGYDPDNARSLGEVGREGVSVATIQDMDILFSGIALNQVTTSMTINCTAEPISTALSSVAFGMPSCWRPPPPLPSFVTRRSAPPRAGARRLRSHPLNRPAWLANWVVRRSGGSDE